MSKRVYRKYDALLNDLREKITRGYYSTGNKIPAVRRLSQIYEVSPNTAYRAVKELQKENLVEIKSGSRGAYCRKDIDMARWKKGDTFLFMLEKDFFKEKKSGDLFLQKIIDATQEELNRHGYKVIFHCMEGDNHEKKFIELAATEWIAGVFINGLVSLPALKKIAELPMPKVTFNGMDNLPNITNFVLDHRLIFRESLKIFKKKKFKRICLYPSLENARLEPQWLSYYHALWEKLAITYGFSSDEITQTREVYPKSEHSLPEQFGLAMTGNAPWTSLGIFAASATFAKQLFDAIKKTGLVFGKDIGLIGVYDYLTPDGGEEAFSTWKIDMEKVGESIADELVELHRNPDFPNSVIRYSGKYVNRGSC